jgi:hypothetical protein
MAAAEDLFEEAEKDLRLPAIMPPKREAYIRPSAWLLYRVQGLNETF